MSLNVFSTVEQPFHVVSWSGLMAALVAVGITVIGIREVFQPAIAAEQFGVPLTHQSDADFLAIKGARDVASGVVVFALLALHNRESLIYAIAALTLIPIFDGLIVFRHAAWSFVPQILIHWGTAVFMLVIVALLAGGK
jgi:hypothetical protein